MANFSYTVDTTEMARSLDGVSRHVMGATTAVVAMEAAVIAAEKLATDRICDNVDRGFFLLIRSQISQKIAKLRSEVDSRTLEMRQQSQALGGIRSRMERDYEMIAARFANLFRSIDLSLKTRVTELDKALFSLVSRDGAHFLRRTEGAQALVPMMQTETVQGAQVVATSHTKASARRAILAMGVFLSDSRRQSALLESTLFSSGKDAEIHYAPVLLVETDSSGGGESQQWDLRTSTASVGMAAALTVAANQAVYGALETLRWKPAEREVLARVSGEFRQLVTKSGFDERVRNHMIRMFDASPWFAMERGKK